jgi:hypothetical protein
VSRAAGPGQPGRDDDRDPSARLAAWRSAGFTDEQARAFRRWRFSLAQAVAWRQAGVPDGLRAAQWMTAGATPATVGDWRTAGIDAAQAVHWHEIGYDLRAARDAVRHGLTPDTAFGQSTRRGPAGTSASALSFAAGAGARGEVLRRLHHEGVPLELIPGYAARKWDVEDALPWARAGIEASDALLWRALGVTPAEAARLERKGTSAADTMRDWWRAGIPFDEVADWIGAGLTPGEAADQRAGGVTAEQAAALRALRDQEEDDG